MLTLVHAQNEIALGYVSNNHLLFWITDAFEVTSSDDYQFLLIDQFLQDGVDG